MDRHMFSKTAVVRRFTALILMLAMSFSLPVSAGSYLTSRADMPEETDAQVVTVTMKNRKGPKTFKIRAQAGFGRNEKSYIARHGCAVSALTTVLGAYKKKYASWNRADVYKKLEKKVFGRKVWLRNYSKSGASRSPVSMYGISRVLKKCGVKNKYVRRFSDKSAIRRIERHLKKGNVVIIEMNNHKQKNGVIKKSYNTKWAKSKHTMVLIGMTDEGKAIIADSATRSWSGSDQRIKYAYVKNLVKYMISCRSSAKYCYYHSSSDSGGYILVNP